MERSYLVLLIEIPLILGIAGFFWWRQRRTRKRAEQKLGQFNTIYDLMYYSEEKLFEKFLNANSGLKGVGGIDGKTFQYLQNGEQGLQLRFDNNELKLTLIHTGSFFSVLPHLIRAEVNGRKHYFSVTTSLGTVNRRKTIEFYERWRKQLNQSPHTHHVESKLIKYVGIPLVLVAISAVVAAIVAGINTGKAYGISYLAQHHNAVFAASDTSIYHFNHQGKLLAEKSLRQFGVDGIAAIIALSDQELLLGDIKQHQILRCQWQSAQCTALTSAPLSNAPEKTFKVAYSNENGHLYLTDTTGHRLLTYNKQGQLLHESKRTEVPELCYPNAILLRDNRLWIADTNYHRIVEIPLINAIPAMADRVVHEMAHNSGRVVHCDKTSQTHKEVSALSSLQTDHIWPTALTPSADGWWVLIKGRKLLHGSLAHFTAEWTPTSVALPIRDGFLDDLIALNDNTLLLADGQFGRLYSLAKGSLVPTLWGDANYQTIVQQRIAKKKDAQTLMLSAISTVIAMLFAVLILSVWQSRQQMVKIRQLP